MKSVVCRFATGVTRGVYDKADDTSGEALVDSYLVKNKGCFGCSIGCGRVTRIPDGPFKSMGEGPEYEAAGPMVQTVASMIWPLICKANFLCNQYGMDPITLGSTIACAMELYEKGLLSEEEIGRPLPFGDAQAMVELTEITGKMEGFGVELAQGSYRLAEKHGAPELSMSVKSRKCQPMMGALFRGWPLNSYIKPRRLPCARLPDFT